MSIKVEPLPSLVWLIPVENYPNDRLNMAEILVWSDSLEEALQIAKKALKSDAKFNPELGRPEVFSSRVYINQGSDY